MSDKKPRTMTEKGFLHKSGIAKSAVAFLAAHREYLTTGELAQFTSPIVARIDEGSLMPTPGLAEVRNVVLAHMLAKETLKGEAAMLKNGPTGQATGTSNKAYIATIYNADGTIATHRNTDKDSENFGKEKDLIEGFELGQRANEWAYRRLFEQGEGAYAEVVATKLVTANGPMTERFNRDQAIEKLFPKSKGPVMHKKPQSTDKLSFGVKVSNYVAKFSRG